MLSCSYSLYSLFAPWIGVLLRSGQLPLTPVRATASYSNEGLVAWTILTCAADHGRVSAKGDCEIVLCTFGLCRFL